MIIQPADRIVKVPSVKIVIRNGSGREQEIAKGDKDDRKEGIVKEDRQEEEEEAETEARERPRRPGVRRR